MKKSLLAVAVTLAAISSAHAAIDGRSLPNGGNTSNFTGGANFADSLANGQATVDGGGEFLLAVFNDSKSYALDLGIRFDAIFDGDVADGTTWSLTGFNFGGGDAFQWNVGALSGRTTYLNPTSTNQRARYGLISTVAGEQTAADFSNGNLVGAMGKLTAQAANLNQTDANYAANNAYIANTNTDSNYVGSGDYGNSFGGQFVFGTSGTDGMTLELQLLGLTDAGLTRVLGSLGSFTLNGNTLTYNAPAVPVPAAAWLMGSALAGLGTVARRRRVKV